MNKEQQKYYKTFLLDNNLENSETNMKTFDYIQRVTKKDIIDKNTYEIYSFITYDFNSHDFKYNDENIKICKTMQKEKGYLSKDTFINIKTISKILKSEFNIRSPFKINIDLENTKKEIQKIVKQKTLPEKIIKLLGGSIQKKYYDKIEETGIIFE